MRLPLVEALRRMLALGCLFAGVWMSLQSGGRVIVARVVDFEHDFAHNPYFSSKDETLAHFIRRRTEGRTRVVTGREWVRLVEAMRDEPFDGSLQRLPRSAGEESWAFRPEALPSLPGGLLEAYTYVRVQPDDIWITLDPEDASEVRGLDGRWAHPRRTLGLVLLPLAFLIYFFVPRIKPPSGSLVYARGPSVIAPDLLGLIGGGFFFALPLFILAENAPGQLPWSTEGGWHFLTGAMALMVAGFLALNLVGFFYSTLYLELTEDALRIGRWTGACAYSWADMEACSPYQSNRGKVLGLLLIVLANSPGMVGQGLLVASNTERGLEIRMKNGKTLRIMANSLPGYANVVEALRQRHVSGAAALDD